MKRKYLLAVDVGGTKTEVILAAGNHDRSGIVAQHVYASQEFEGLDAIIADFLARPEARKRAGALAAACFSVAGPVEEERATLTNLDWRISAEALRERFALPAVRVINDFAAAGLGIGRLAAGDLDTLQTGQPVAHGTRVIIGAGTGLGVAMLTWNGNDYMAHPSEAGHADFAPLDETQDGLLVYLRRTLGHVSYERIVSGPGLARIFDYLKDAGLGVPSAPMLEAMNHHEDAAQVIAEFGLSRRDPMAARALDLFVAAYGAFAGNVALTVLARGGVYIAGGIAPKIAAKLRDGTFIRAFAAKGRFNSLLSTVPVCVVMNSRVGLYGALLEAVRLSRVTK